MNNYFNRINAVLCTFIACLSLVALFNYGSSYLFPHSPTGTLENIKIYDMTVNNYLQCDESNISMTINADLSSAFNWNTKQLYVYVTGSYTTLKNVRNEVTIWDTIVTESDAVFKLKNELNKYSLRDEARLLRGRDVELILKYKYMPIVGSSREYFVNSSKILLPMKYFR